MRPRREKKIEDWKFKAYEMERQRPVVWKSKD
jgi:hypothetical protein